MKFIPLFLLLLTSPLLVARAQEPGVPIEHLRGPDYEARQSARNELYTHALEAAAGRNPEALAELETILTGAVASSSLDREAKLFVTRLLAMAASSRAAESIYATIQALSEDAILRDHLIQALSALPGPEVSQLLLQGLAGASAEEATAWWQAIGRQAAPDQVPAIVAILQTGKAALTPDAVAALGAVGGTAAADYLFQEWNRAPAEGREALELALLDSAACDLDQLQELLAGSENLPARLGAFGQIMDRSEKAALEILAGLLDNSEPTDESAFIATALSSGSDDAWTFILENLGQLDEREQAVLIGAIAGQGKSELEPVVLELARSGSAETQAVALRALAVIGGPASVPYLSELLLAEDEALQELAAYALSTVVDPQLDQQILEIVSDPGHPARSEYLALMAIRNNDGAVERVNTLLWEEMRTPAIGDILSAVEQIGDLDSCRILVHAILHNNPDLPTRKLQLSLKRLSLRLAIEDYLWEELYLPSLVNAPNDASRARIIEILDCLSLSDGAMEYVTGILDDAGEGELEKAAGSAARRWTSLNIGQYWLRIARDRNSSSDQIRTAMAALVRLITSDSIEAKDNEKAEFALKVLTQLRDDNLKEEILAAVLGERSVKSPFLNSLKPYRFIIDQVDGDGKTTDDEAE